MTTVAERLVRPALLALEPERAHRAALLLMRLAPVRTPRPDSDRLAVEAFGLRFPNPVGLAAGFDKSGELGERAFQFGFGATEVGTLTPLPQVGNPRPRVFRLPGDRAVINRYGFNNDGQAAARRRLTCGPRRGVLGVNLGANKKSADRVADYTAGLRALVDVADYFTLNVSSPNTPGLRDLQAAQALDDLLARALEVRDALAAHHGRRPMLLKISPDLSLHALDDVVEAACRRGIDGLIVSNTTVARSLGLTARHAAETGGLSGRPLFGASTRLLAETFLRIDGRMPLVGVGGIDSPDLALAKLRAGATLVQLYSGLVYEGLSLVSRIKTHLDTIVQAEQTSLQQLVGRDAQAIIRGQSDRDLQSA